MAQSNASGSWLPSASGQGAIPVMLALAALTVLVWLAVYPFIATADGIVRVEVATGSAPKSIVLAPLQGHLLGLSVAALGTVDGFVLAQIFLFYAAVFVGYRAMLHGRHPGTVALATAATLAFPVFLMFPAILTDSALVFVAMAGLSAMLAALWGRSAAPGARLWVFAAAAVLLFLLFGMRMNAVVVAPVILVLAWVGCRPFIGALLLGMALAIAAVAVLNADLRRTARPEALGMAWEIVGAARHAPDALGTALDFCGDTRRAMAIYHDRYLNPIFWDSDPPLPGACIASVEGAARVRDVYLSVIASHPVAWARAKAALWLRLAGVQPLERLNRGIHGVDAFTQAHGGRPSLIQDVGRGLFSRSGDLLLPQRPFLSALLAALAVAAVWRRAGARAAPIAIPVLLGNAYYAGFFINAQAAEFRYFAPTFFLNTMATVAAAILLWESRAHLRGRPAH